MCGCKIDPAKTGQWFGFPDWQCGLCGWVHDDAYCQQCGGLLQTSGNPFKHDCPVYAELERESARTGADIDQQVDYRVRINRIAPPYQSPAGECACDFSSCTPKETRAFLEPVALERCPECQCRRARWLCKKCGRAYAEGWSASPWHRPGCKAEQQASV